MALDVYQLAKAVYADDFQAARSTLDAALTSDFAVLRARLAAGAPPATTTVSIAYDVQERLAERMAPEERKVLCLNVQPRHRRR